MYLFCTNSVLKSMQIPSAKTCHTLYYGPILSIKKNSYYNFCLIKLLIFCLLVVNVVVKFRY